MSFVQEVLEHKNINNCHCPLILEFDWLLLNNVQHKQLLTNT